MIGSPRRLRAARDLAVIRCSFLDDAVTVDTMVASVFLSQGQIRTARAPTSQPRPMRASGVISKNKKRLPGLGSVRRRRKGGSRYRSLLFFTPVLVPFVVPGSKRFASLGERANGRCRGVVVFEIRVRSSARFWLCGPLELSRSRASSVPERGPPVRRRGRGTFHVFGACRSPPLRVGFGSGLEAGKA